MCNNQRETSHIVDEGISEVAIKDLKGCNFFVPSYQRGYRWTRQQVEELINDIFELLDKDESLDKDNGQNRKYCLQPLVVKKINDDRGKFSWEVIDGQQRLTTIFIILKFLEEDSYTLSYETRKKSKGFLDTIDKAQYSAASENIDFYHMYQTYQTVQKLFATSYSERKVSFKKFLLNNVMFIWYSIDLNQNPIEVFTRLNIDKISLTPSELIKALLLNKSNFSSQYGADKIHMRQQEIASEWDSIENQLQDDSFWLFFHDVGYRSSTRIDYLFEILCDQNMLPEVNKGNIGNDDARTFRYIYKYFKCKGDSQNNKNVPDVSKSQKMNNVWSQVKSIFDTLNEWYNDLELYHYVGYILSRPRESTRVAGNPIEMKNEVYELWTEWNKNSMTVSKFKYFLHDKIQGLIDGCNDISKEYEKGCSKTVCRPILLLHNVLTVIQQGQVAQKAYAQDITVKFPFNLYKMEKWDVEHIDSNTTNDLLDFDQQKEWLLTNYIVVKDISQDENNQAESLTSRIKKFCERTFEDMDEDSKRNIYFNELCNEIKGYISDDNLSENKNGRNEKNLLWNFTLLDEKTNRGYGNAIFPAKRRIIIGKEQGKYYPCPTCNAQKGFKDSVPVTATSSFILPCTKQAFMKYYSPMSGSMTVWTRYDAEAYQKNIIDIIKNEFKFKVKKDGQDI